MLKSLRVEEGIHNSSRDEMLEELLESKEKLLEDKLEELAIYKTKTEALGTELSTVKRHLASSSRAVASSKQEFQRLNKIDVAYSKLLEDHFGGQEG